MELEVQDVALVVDVEEDNSVNSKQLTVNSQQSTVNSQQYCRVGIAINHDKKRFLNGATPLRSGYLSQRSI